MIELNDKKLTAVLMNRLSLSTNCDILIETEIRSRIEIRPDIYIEDGNRKIVVDVHKRVDLNSISRSFLYRRLLPDHEIVLATRVISNDLGELASDLGIGLIRIPPAVPMGVFTNARQPKGKITSIKSWKVFTRILLEGLSSIRNVSMSENISYAWTHRTVRSLLEIGIFSKEGDLITIGDMGKALDLASFERPLEELKIGVVNVPKDLTLADISTNLEDMGLDHMFTALTSGSLYSGYGVRHDSFHIYMDEIEGLREMFNNGEKKLIVYRPDRDFSLESMKIDGIRVVSLDQTIMDLAGLGYSARDMALHMVRNYADIRSNYKDLAE